MAGRQREARPGARPLREEPAWKTRWCPKHLIEVLQAQQTFAPPGHGTVDEIQRLIDWLVLEHRPHGPDGKHGTMHTDTCGCEDKD